MARRPLQYREVGRGGQDPAPLDPAEDGMGEVVSDDLDPVPKPTRPKDADGGIRGHGAADDVVNIRTLLERVLDQQELNLLAGIPPFRDYDLDRAVGDGAAKALLHEIDPAGALRAGEPGDLHGFTASRVELRQIVAGPGTHGDPRDARLGGDAPVGIEGQLELKSDLNLRMRVLVD